MNEQSFLQHLIAKKATVLTIQATTGRNCQSALKEVDRQIEQCVRGGGADGGGKVTKSGIED